MSQLDFSITTLQSQKAVLMTLFVETNHYHYFAVGKSLLPCTTWTVACFRGPIIAELGERMRATHVPNSDLCAHMKPQTFVLCKNF